MTFGYPAYLWLLLVIPPGMMLFFWWSARERQRLMTQFIQARLLPGLVSGISTTRQKIRAASLVAAVACLIIALAEPRWGYDMEEVAQRALDIVVAVDTSKSMLAADIAPNRLTRAKLAALDLMQQAKSDRLGLVAFAGSAFLQCPLTVDDVVFRQSVESLDVNSVSEGGTALAAAIETAAEAFKEGDNYKVLVLFSDGEDHDSGALAAAKKAAEAGLRIFTIGIGSAEGDCPRVKNAEGKLDFLRDARGDVVKSHLNEALLQEIAGAANGFYLPLRGANPIDVLYQKGLAPLPKTELKEKWVKRLRERYHWPLALAMVLLILELFLPERKLAAKNGGHFGSLRQERENPSRAEKQDASAGRKPPLAAAASPEKSSLGARIALCLFLALPAMSFGSPASALRQYHSGNYEQALKEYERLAAEDKTGDARFAFNAGTAAYRATNYDAAIKFFTTALSAREVKLQQAAYFNLGNAQFRLGQSAKDIDELQKIWETAIKSYENAVTLDKKDADAAYNLAFAKRGVAQIEQLRAAMRQAKESADEAARRRNYRHALEIMQAIMQQSPLGKQFEDYTKKLQDIDAIASPQQP